MRLIVVSDSHSRRTNLNNVVFDEPEAEYIIHLGDGERDVDDLITRYPEKKFIQVSGNCDYLPYNPTVRIETIAGVKIYICHGHTLNVKTSLETLKSTARNAGCCIALFGHTHIPFTLYEDGLYIVNPGSISKSITCTYSTIDITNSGIVPNIITIK